jgi:2-oxoglutarate dehydrogenase E2 component (dihydrolipoamide succinyltransferase)
VKADEPVAELETDKANVDLVRASAGVLRRVKNEGDTVRVGEAIGRVDAGGGGGGAAAAAAAAARPGRRPRRVPARARRCSGSGGAAANKLEDLSPRRGGS